MVTFLHGHHSSPCALQMPYACCLLSGDNNHQEVTRGKCQSGPCAHDDVAASASPTSDAVSDSLNRNVLVRPISTPILSAISNHSVSTLTQNLPNLTSLFELHLHIRFDWQRKRLGMNRVRGAQVACIWPMTSASRQGSTYLRSVCCAQNRDTGYGLGPRLHAQLQT